MGWRRGVDEAARQWPLGRLRHCERHIEVGVRSVDVRDYASTDRLMLTVTRSARSASCFSRLCQIQCVVAGRSVGHGVDYLQAVTDVTNGVGLFVVSRIVKLVV